MILLSVLMAIYYDLNITQHCFHLILIHIFCLKRQILKPRKYLTGLFKQPVTQPPLDRIGEFQKENKFLGVMLINHLHRNNI